MRYKVTIIGYIEVEEQDTMDFENEVFDKLDLEELEIRFEEEA